MTDDSTGIIGKVVLGGAVGFALFLLGTSWGTRGRGIGGGEEAPSPPRPIPIPAPTPRSTSKDKEPLLYVVVESEDVGKPPASTDVATRARSNVRFRRLDTDAKVAPAEIRRRMAELLQREEKDGIPPISVDEVIMRVQAGGRDDVRLINTGQIRARTMNDARDALMSAGIKHWILWEEAPADREPGKPTSPPRWELFDKDSAVTNPDNRGHYLFQTIRSALLPEESKPQISGEGRGYYGRSWGMYR